MPKYIDSKDDNAEEIAAFSQIGATKEALQNVCARHHAKLTSMAEVIAMAIELLTNKRAPAEAASPEPDPQKEVGEAQESAKPLHKRRKIKHREVKHA